MSKKNINTAAMPQKVKEALVQVGGNIMIARKHRGYTQQKLADLIFVDRNTIGRIEKGDPGVSIGIIAHALWALQLDDDLLALAKPENDQLGLSLSKSSIKKRVREPKKAFEEYDF